MKSRSVRFLLPLPDRDGFARTPTGQKRTQLQAEKAYEQEIRRLWRALALAVKAKLEVVESGIAEFEDEFLAYILIPGTTRTMGEWAKPELEAAYVSDGAPRMLALPRGDE